MMDSDVELFKTKKHYFRAILVCIGVVGVSLGVAYYFNSDAIKTMKFTEIVTSLAGLLAGDFVLMLILYNIYRVAYYSKKIKKWNKLDP
jgi:multisubunit Na+/H+ antiporter MnhG subunit